MIAVFLSCALIWFSLDDTMINHFMCHTGLHVTVPHSHTCFATDAEEDKKARSENIKSQPWAQLPPTQPGFTLMWLSDLVWLGGGGAL